MNINTNLTKNNYIEIFVVIFIIFFMLIVIAILGINLNPEYPPPKLIQEVTIESFINDNGINDNEINDYGINDINQNLDLLQEVKDLHLFPIDSFCASHLGKAGELDVACSNLTKDTCIETNCCVYTSDDKCVAGSNQGPTFVKHQHGIDHYYYQQKMYAKK